MGFKPGEGICIMTRLEVLDTMPLLTGLGSLATFAPATRLLDSRRCEILCQSQEGEQR